ncbi:ASCH domain-containing protein [Patescibacteria group bacterium]|nr:ASCH domain-containing protein [Patescibacteria group bacterium]
MIHSLKLQASPFAKIQAGTKTVEIRLYDEKRKLLTVGDEVEFSLMTDPDQKILTVITELVPFKSFAELFQAFPPESLGVETAGDWDEMYTYYTKEQEREYGVLGICIKLSKKE